MEEDNKALMSRDLVKNEDNQGWSAMHNAAHKGDLDTVCHLLTLPDVDVDMEDKEGWTPLHVACFYNNFQVVKVLLLKGASLTKQVKQSHGCATPKVPAEVFREILDESIQFKEGSKHHIEFNYSFLQTLELNSAKDINSPLDLESQNSLDKDHDSVDLIHSIVNTSKEHWELLKHPVIENYLLQKWNKSKYVACITVLVHITMFALLTTFIVTKYFPSKEEGQKCQDHSEFDGLRISLICCFSFQLLSHLVNLLRTPGYFIRFMLKRPYISLNIVVTLCSLFLVSSTSPQFCDIRRHLSALLLPISCLDLLAHSLGIHPAISPSYLMFIKVQVTFVKNFVFYLPLLAAFGVSFGLIFGPASDFSASRVFLKVVAMFIGEIDYGDIDTDSMDAFAFVCKFLLLLAFIFAFSLTLVNLLNGLAVSDIR